jgi:predicted DNA-binding protein (MmcQ/YjbR family)
MPGVPGASKRIEERVLAWPGVEAHPHRFGGVEYRLGNREVGHIHGDHMLDIAFPKRVREELVSAGLARPHHLLPQSGWVSFYLREEGDVEQAVSLLARSYELAREQQARRNGGPVPGEEPGTEP